jgi:hypothetical protein
VPKSKKPNNLNQNNTRNNAENNANISFDELLKNFTESWQTNPTLEDEELLETAQQKIQTMLKFTLNQIVKENKLLDDLSSVRLDNNDTKDILSSLGLNNNDIKDNLKKRTELNNALKKYHSDVTEFLTTPQSKAWLKKLATSNGKKQDFYNELIDAIIEYQNPKTKNPKTKKFFNEKQKIYNVFLCFYTYRAWEQEDFVEILNNLQNINIYDLNNNKIFTESYGREFTFDVISILEQFLESYTSRSKNHLNYNYLKDIFEVLVHQQENFSKEIQNNEQLETLYKNLYEAKYGNFNLLSVYKKASELFTDEEIKILNKIFFNLITNNLMPALNQSLEAVNKWKERSKNEKQEIIDCLAKTWGSIKLEDPLNQDTIEEALFYDTWKDFLFDCLRKNIRQFALKENSEKLKQNIEEPQAKKEEFKGKEVNTSEGKDNVITYQFINPLKSVEIDNMISQYLKTVKEQNNIPTQNYVKYNKTVDGANIVVNKSDFESKNIAQMIEKMSSQETAGKMFSSQDAPFRKFKDSEYYFYKLNKNIFLAGVKMGDIIFFSNEGIKQTEKDHSSINKNYFLSQANKLTKFNKEYITQNLEQIDFLPAKSLPSKMPKACGW